VHARHFIDVIDAAAPVHPFRLGDSVKQSNN
jgi:hypothetical protein